MKAALASLLLLLPILSACDSNDDPDTPALQTITQTVIDDADLATLEAAVVEAGLAGALAGTGPFTVFAPTESAFAALLQALDVTPAQLLARDDLASILQLHVVSGRLNAADLSIGQTVTTLNGQTLTVVASGNGLGLDTEDAGTEANATITATDIGASNGVVHKISSVLIPNVPLSTITQTVIDDTDLATLEAAVVRAGLADALAGAGPFTVFAPTESAFAALLQALNATPAQLLDRDDLGSILQLHVVSGRLNAADLSIGQTVTTLNGQTLTVVASGNGLGLDTEDEGTEANATITATDIGASNGVVHKIGSVLLPNAN